MFSDAPSGQGVYMAISTDQASFRLVKTYQGTHIWGSGAHYVASQMVRIYASSGDLLQVDAQRDKSSAKMYCYVSFSGYLEGD